MAGDEHPAVTLSRVITGYHAAAVLAADEFSDVAVPLEGLLSARKRKSPGLGRNSRL